MIPYRMEKSARASTAMTEVVKSPAMGVRYCLNKLEADLELMQMSPEGRSLAIVVDKHFSSLHVSI